MTKYNHHKQALLSIPKIYWIAMIVGVLLLQIGLCNLFAADVLPSWLHGNGMVMIVAAVILEVIWVYKLQSAIRQHS